MKINKIFGIGFHKTGTTSLGAALERLNYRVVGNVGFRDPDIERNVYELTDRLIDKYDAFQDNPWPILYRRLDELCPNSKFILTLRPVDKWIASVVRHFGTDHTPMREWIYGVGFPEGNEDIYRARYERHNREVQEYFADRPDDLLVFDLTEGAGWDLLCPFLGRDIPDLAFPHANEANRREKREELMAQRQNSKVQK